MTFQRPLQTGQRIINPHEICGCRDLPFERIHNFYTAGSRNELEGVDFCGQCTQQESGPMEKTYLFVIEKHRRDIKRGQKIALDLLESIMKLTAPANVFLRRILSKMCQFTYEIPEFRVCTLQMSGKITDFRRRLPAGAKWAFFKLFFTRIHLITAPRTSKNLNKCRFWRLWAIYASQSSFCCMGNSQH